MTYFLRLSSDISSLLHSEVVEAITVDERPDTEGADADLSPSPADEALSRTTAVLVKTLRALGAAGRPVAASRLAAQAWSALRHTHPREAEHINGIMHYLARLPDESEAKEEPPCPTTRSSMSAPNPLPVGTR